MAKFNLWKTLVGAGTGFLYGGPWGAAAGAAGALVAGDAEAQAQANADRAYNQSAAATAPSQALQTWASPYLRSIIEGQLAPEARRTTFPALEAQHGLNLDTINKRRDISKGQNVFHWLRAGNVSRARGETFDVEQSARDATVAENTNYGVNTEAMKTNARNTLYQAVANAMGLGQAAISPTVNAAYNSASMKTDASSSTALTLSSILASVYKSQQDAELAKILNPRQLPEHWETPSVGTDAYYKSAHNPYVIDF